MSKTASAPVPAASPRRSTVGPSGRDRSIPRVIWYHFVRYLAGTLGLAIFGWRATGQGNMPESGGVLLVCNHLSFLDVFCLGIPLRRPLNFVARSTLFIPGLGFLMRTIGAFPIQREGIGASGVKETLRRLRAGGIVTLFPEGTRSHDGQLAPLKPGIAVLVTRAGVPVVPVGIAGTFEIWPRSRIVPIPHAIRVHYGPPIWPEDMAGLENEAITLLIRERLERCREEAWRGLHRDAIR